MDITIAQLIAALPDGDPVKTWWESADAIPAQTGVNEFFLKTLKAAADAARAANANQPAGSRIDGYPLPVNGAVTTNDSGVMSFVTTCSVRGRVPVNYDVAISPLV